MILLRRFPGEHHCQSILINLSGKSAVIGSFWKSISVGYCQAYFRFLISRKVVPFLYINALRHVCRRWPISTRSRERKTKIFRSKSAKIVQKLLGLVQFFNLEHQYCQKFLGAVQFLNFILKVVFIQFSCSGALFPLSCPCSATKRTFL